ncbi:hypothetical protein JXQ31_08940, partial [candidate division KSB1 bacterium]|nr:hypothetical protein [candidate division KSB1 bacterium]
IDIIVVIIIKQLGELFHFYFFLLFNIMSTSNIINAEAGASAELKFFRSARAGALADKLS